MAGRKQVSQSLRARQQLQVQRMVEQVEMDGVRKTAASARAVLPVPRGPNRKKLWRAASANGSYTP
jgi:hypothetical protein